jgi:hypothetical protein
MNRNKQIPIAFRKEVQQTIKRKSEVPVELMIARIEQKLKLIQFGTWVVIKMPSRRTGSVSSGNLSIPCGWWRAR